MPRKRNPPMAAEQAVPPRASRFRALVLIVLASCCGCAIWNSVKPMPAGTHVITLPARLADSQIDFIDDVPRRARLLGRELHAVDRADQMIVIDECPLARELGEHLLARKRQRPNLSIVLVTDPRGEVFGGTPTGTLNTLEQAGIIVARVRLERLRDSNPSYSSLWRLALGWWSDTAGDRADEETLLSRLRQLNLKADRRQVLVADDGAGGWSSILASAPVPEGGDVLNAAGLEIHGPLAHDIAASELRIAGWSTDDDRLPGYPPVNAGRLGSIDARYLTEGAIAPALVEAIAAAGGDDTIDGIFRELADRRIIGALLEAASRGARVRLLLDPGFPANQAVAAELRRDAADRLSLRWTAASVARYLIVRHRNDLWLNLGSADPTRRALDDLDLESNVELHLPAHAAPARAAAGAFDREWRDAAAYTDHANESAGLYLRYRVAEASGLAMF